MKDTLSKAEPIFRCDFVRNDKAITLSTFYQFDQLNLENECFTDFQLIYQYSLKPISEVNIILDNDTRLVKIRGIDEKKVEALYRDVDAQLKSKEPFLASIKWEVIFALASLFLFILAIAIVLPNSKKSFFKTANKRSILIYILSMLYAFFSIIFFFSDLNFSDYVPSLVITQETTSWIDKNANLLGFIGFIITIVSLIVKFYKWTLLSKNEKASETKSESN